MSTQANTLTYAFTNNISGGIQLDFADVQLHNGLGTWTNQTSACSTIDNTTAQSWTSISSVNYCVSGAEWYFGSDNRFNMIYFNLSSASSNNSQTPVYEYWNGSDWTVLSKSGSTQAVRVMVGSLDLKNAQYHNIRCWVPDDWAATTVNGGSSRYYLKVRQTVQAFTTFSVINVTTGSVYETCSTNIPRHVFTTVDDSAFTDVTRQAMSSVSNAFTWTANVTGAKLYVGCSNKFDALTWLLTTSGTLGNNKLQYYNGSTWIDLNEAFSNTLTTSTSYDLSKKMQNTSFHPYVFWDTPADWVTNAVNGKTNYWIRIVPTVVYGTSPQFSTMIPIPYTVYSKTVYSPDTTNREIKSAYFKISTTNDIDSSTNFIHARIKKSSDSSWVHISPNYQNANQPFLAMGGAIINQATEITQDSFDWPVDITLSNNVNDALYFVYPPTESYRLHQPTIAIITSTVRTSGARIWEYSTPGSTWTEFTPVVVGGNKHLNQAVTTNIGTEIQVPSLSGWATTTTSTYTGYQIRSRVLTPYVANGQLAAIFTSVPYGNNEQIVNSGEAYTMYYLVDATDWFKNNYTGTSQNIDFGISEYASLSTARLVPNKYYSVELVMTYTADVSGTSIKTVNIPLNSQLGNITNTLTTFDTIPALNDYLPEAGKVVRDCYIKLIGNNIAENVTTAQIGIQIDSDDVNYSNVLENSLLSSTMDKFIINCSSMNISAGHDLKIGLRGPLNVEYSNLSAEMVVTYEYDLANSSRVMNSIILPYNITTQGLRPSVEIEDAEIISGDFYIQEPASISGARVGLYGYYTDTGSSYIGLKGEYESSETNLIYDSTSSVHCGGFTFGRLINNIPNFSRGKNIIKTSLINKSLINSAYFVSGYYLVNYTSGIYTNGSKQPNKHNRSVSTLVNNLGTNRNFYKTKYSNDSLGTEYYLNDAAFCIYNISQNASTFSSNVDIMVDRRNQTPSIIPLGSSGWANDGELMTFINYISFHENVKNYPTQNRLYNMGTAETLRIEVGNLPIKSSIENIIAVHNITHSGTGSIVGYDGDGSGISVNIYNTNLDILINTTTTIGGGFAFTWYDNTENILCIALNVANGKYYSSAPQKVDDSSFSIDFSSTSTNEFSYGFIG